MELMRINDNDYGAYLSRKIATADAEIKALIDEMTGHQKKIKQIKKFIDLRNKEVARLAADKEEFINFQKRKK
jgi:predicted phage tail protein